MEERTFATPRHSEELHVLSPSTITYHSGGPQALKELLVGNLGPYYARREAREIAAQIRAETYVDGLDAAEAIPLRNGDLSLQPRALKEVSSKRRFRVRSSARWTEEARCPPLKNVLQEAVPTRQDRRALQEYLGYCLMHWARPYRRVLLLAGPDGSGWGLFLQAVSAIVPWSATVSPKHLARRAGGPQLRGPWVNARAGISPEALTDLQTLRGLVAGRPGYSDPDQIRKAMQVPSSQWGTKHIYTAANLPPLPAGDRFFRRILLVPFPAKLPSETLFPEGTGEELTERFKAERDGILRWAVAGLERVLEHGGFPSERPPDATRRRWESLSGPIGRFKADRLTVTGDPQDVVPKDTLYPVYKQFCRQEGVFAESKKQFTKTLTQDPRIEGRKRTPEPGADQVRCYVGVKPRNT
jgi:putative DNA primase/helicase